jgi:hypothetical protein
MGSPKFEIAEQIKMWIVVYLNSCADSRSLKGNSARIVRSDQSPNQPKSPTGLSDADHSTNTPWRTTPDAESYS